MGSDDLKIGSVAFGPVPRKLPSTWELREPIMFAINLSALPPATRPSVAAALQAAVGRLAECGTGIDPTAPEDAILAELVKGQMRGILAGAAKAEGGTDADVCRHGTPYRYACEACGDGPEAGE